jgi:acyl-CoA-binding protein
VVEARARVRDDMDGALNQRFTQAAEKLRNASQPAMSRSDKLEFYALYKQSTAGDAPARRPSMFDVVGSKKWEAWHRHRLITFPPRSVSLCRQSSNCGF